MTSARRCAHTGWRPVLFLTARGAFTDRLAGFGAGGDDYLTKPFALAELLVRVHALGRRRGPPSLRNRAACGSTPPPMPSAPATAAGR